MVQFCCIVGTHFGTCILRNTEENKRHELNQREVTRVEIMFTKQELVFLLLLLYIQKNLNWLMITFRRMPGFTILLMFKNIFLIL